MAENERTVHTSIEELNQPLRARVDAVETANSRALQKADQERREAVAALREALTEKITSAEHYLDQKLVNVKELLQQQIVANRELVEQYHDDEKAARHLAAEEREKSAATLREEVQRAAEVLREAVARETASADENLRQHIEHQREQVDAAFAASKEAITKAEVATEREFEAVHRNHERLQHLTEKNLPRELFDSAQQEFRERGATNLELIQALALRMAEMEARGGGEKDHAADLKSSLAIGVAIIAVIASTAIGLIAMFGT